MGVVLIYDSEFKTFNPPIRMYTQLNADFNTIIQELFVKCGQKMRKVRQKRWAGDEQKMDKWIGIVRPTININKEFNYSPDEHLSPV